MVAAGLGLPVALLGLLAAAAPATAAACRGGSCTVGSLAHAAAPAHAVPGVATVAAIPQAAARLPFNYTVNFDSSLRGRDMKTASGNFCNRYRADSVVNPAATPYILITLVRNRAGLPDIRLETHRFRNNGRVHAFCWPHHSGSATYHFQYEVPNIGYRVTGHGTVYRR